MIYYSTDITNPGLEAGDSAIDSLEAGDAASARYGTGGSPGRVFAPGCALMLYKPHLAEKLNVILNKHLGPMDNLLTCCKHEPQVENPTEIINICPGCDKRFTNDYEHTTTISLWEILAVSDFFPFPDYGGREMTILDACPTREKADEETHIGNAPRGRGGLLYFMHQVSPHWG